jgi:hypothetical protein
MGEKRNAYRGFGWVPEEKLPLGRPKRKREDIIKMYLQWMGWECVDWINMTEGKSKWQALVNMAIKILVA